MKIGKKSLIIIKLGGSIITYKQRSGVFLRRKTLARIAQEIHRAQERNPTLRIILIHGAGAGGHQLADKYQLTKGLRHHPERWEGALLTRIANQYLNLEIFKILSANHLRVIPVHTASVVTQKNKAIFSFAREALDEALKNQCIPLLYGELVFDTKLGMSVCSGDTSAVLLAHRYEAQQIIYASDIDGIFDRDPHQYNNATLIRTISLRNLLKDKSIALAGSHHVDVTGGLFNKIAELSHHPLPDSLERVVVCSGLKSGILERAIKGEEAGTVIRIKDEKRKGH